MTKEEQQFNQWFDWYADGVKVFEEADMKQAYLQGRAELEKENKVLTQNLEDTEIINNTLEKENAELKEQIEKMKCCENCKHHRSWVILGCDLMYDIETECLKTKNKWELRR